MENVQKITFWAFNMLFLGIVNIYYPKKTGGRS